MENGKKPSQVVLRLGIASAVALGALASGFLISRRGRRFVQDVWHEKRRTPLEDRVIDTIWGEPILGKREIDVAEVEPGIIAVLGQVRSDDERRDLLTIASSIKGVKEVEDRLEIVPRRRRRTG